MKSSGLLSSGTHRKVSGASVEFMLCCHWLQKLVDTARTEEARGNSAAEAQPGSRTSGGRGKGHAAGHASTDDHTKNIKWLLAQSPALPCLLFHTLASTTAIMITVTNPDDDGIYPLDCDASIALADVKALLEADSSIPASRQTLYFNGAPMQDDSKTLQGYGVGDGDLLLLRDAQAGQSSSSATGRPGGSVATSAPPPGAPRNEEEAIEQLRQQVLTDSHLMTQLRQSNPQLANAASSSPAEFARLLGEMRRQMGQVQSERARAEAELAGADEFDIDAQRRIEEAIQAENVMANMEHAMGECSTVNREATGCLLMPLLFSSHFASQNTVRRASEGFICCMSLRKSTA